VIQRIWASFLFVVGLVIFALAVITAYSPEAKASICEHRSTAHGMEHGGTKFDSDWHVAHGDLPTCDAERQALSQPEPAIQDNNKPSDEDKSRYCRKHWYC